MDLLDRESMEMSREPYMEFSITTELSERLANLKESNNFFGACTQFSLGHSIPVRAAGKKRNLKYIQLETDLKDSVRIPHWRIGLYDSSGKTVISRVINLGGDYQIATDDELKIWQDSAFKYHRIAEAKIRKVFREGGFVDKDFFSFLKRQI